jgi:hypothetical protein
LLSDLDFATSDFCIDATISPLTYTIGGFTLKFLVMALRRQQSRRLMSRHAEDDLVMAVTITQLAHIEEEEEEEEPC